MSIQAMKQALEALESCDWNDNDFPDDTQYFDRFKVCEASTALRAAIEQAEKAEPVAWMMLCDGQCMGFLPYKDRHGESVPVFTHPSQPPEGCQLVPVELPDYVSDELNEKYGYIARGWKVAYFRILNLLAAAPKEKP